MTAFLTYGPPITFVVMLCCYLAYRAGKSEGRTAEKTAEDIKDKVIEDRLRRDADFAKRVRQRFTR